MSIPLKINPDLWESKYINLLRVIMKGLRTEERGSLITFLLENNQDVLAHSTLLELQIDEYRQTPSTTVVCDRLIAALDLATPDANDGDPDLLRKKKGIADALGYYDHRLYPLNELQNNFPSNKEQLQ